ncbi:MAG: helix-turn-helix domain-containing protein [Sphingobacteriaceae bacterium]
MNQHNGEIIERLVRRNGVSISELARRIHVNRRSIYNWFNKKTLKLDVIIKIGNVIGCDFSKEFPDVFSPEEFAMMNGLREYNEEKPVLEPKQSTQFWIDKYVALLEEYNQLLLKQTYRSELMGRENSEVNFTMKKVSANKELQ